MKKTLAAVLAAAMALSTATVAFAADSQDIGMVVEDKTLTVDATGKDDEISVKIGDTIKKKVGAVTNITGRDVAPDGSGEIGEEDLAKLIKDGVIRATVTVTSGKNNLDSSPVVKVVGKETQLQFKFKHTYNTSSSKASMKIRLNVAKDLYFDPGDTLNGPEVTYKAEYATIDYSKDMTITIQEVKDNIVRAKGEDLFASAGSDDKVTIYFDNYAAFEAKISPSQKDVNLYYSVDEVSDVVNAYPNVDFGFLTFKGASSVTSFVNSGTMTFNAIGGKNTQVYTFDGETLSPLDGTYDSSYGTVTVKGIKRLGGTFVVASEILEVEDEEDNEPVSSAPVVEEPSSQPADNSGDRNPSTGAC